MSKITVLKSTVTKAEKGYPIVELAYRNESGQTKGLKIFGFGQQEKLAAIASSVVTGDVLDVTFAKNERGFWQFHTMEKVLDQPEREVTKDMGTAAPVTRSNWETPEERAVRQVRI